MGKGRIDDGVGMLHVVKGRSSTIMVIMVW